MYKRKLLVSLALGIVMITCVFLGIGIFSSRHSGKVTASAAAPPITPCSCTVKMPEPHRTEPTCTTSGSVWTTCGNCGKRIGNSQTLAALGHNYTWVIDTAATCTTEGSRHQVCTRCDATGTTETIAVLAHTSDGIRHVDEPTCTTKGYIYNLCTVCGARINVTMQNALGHSYSWVTDKEATCTEEGSRHEECVRCHVTGTTETIAMVEHTSDGINHVEAPTCTAKGYTYNLCTECGARINVTIQNALGHSYSWVRTTSPTCTSEGVDSYQCSRCRDVTETRSVAMVEHTSDMINHVDEPTCTEKGYIYNLCTVCGARINVQIQNALGHSYSWVRTTEPTCTSEGTDSYKCSHCGDVTETRSVAALGHDYKWIVVQEATCTREGLRYQRCSRCILQTSVEGYYAAHTPGLGELVAPTCTTPGCTIYRCSVCNAETSRGNIVPALGHSCNVPDATCTVSMVCDRCGLVIKPARGHDTHACVDETCGVCGEMVAATEYHAWGEWQLVRQATATQDGEKMRTCGVCGGTQTQTIPKTSGSGENTGDSGSGGSGGSGSGENTGGSGGSGGSDKDPGGSDGGAGGGGSGSWTDSLLPGVSDSMKVIIAAGAGVLLFAVGIGIYFAISGKRRKRR